MEKHGPRLPQCLRFLWLAEISTRLLPAGRERARRPPERRRRLGQVWKDTGAKSCTSPMEYAVELHRLIQLEMEGSVG